MSAWIADWCFPFGGNRYGGAVMMITGFLLLGLIIYLVFAKSSRSNIFPFERDAEVHKDPMEVLEMRYAEGEISKDEYLRMREVLEK